MPNLTKTTLLQPTAAKIIARHFGTHNTLVSFQELRDGYYNSAYLLELDDGLKYVIKVAPPPSVSVLAYERGIMTAEVEVMRLVRQQTEMPVPEVMVHDTSGILLPNEYFIMRYAAGVPYHKLRSSLSQSDQDAIDRQVGIYLRQMNAINGDRFGYYAQPQPREVTWCETFDSMLKGILDDGNRIPVCLPEAVYILASRHFEVLEAISSPCLVHWDVWDGNVIVDPDTKRISAIVDFERTLWGDPLMECNFSFINEAFLEGYGKNMLVEAGQRTRRTLYNIYLFLIMVIECYYRQYETDEQEKWARMRLDQELAALS